MGFIADTFHLPPKQRKAPNEDVYPEDIEKAAGLIIHAFPWGDTEEGHAYWADVCERLRRIAANGR